jgi:hypothetical protein
MGRHGDVELSRRFAEHVADAPIVSLTTRVSALSRLATYELDHGAELRTTRPMVRLLSLANHPYSTIARPAPSTHAIRR